MKDVFLYDGIRTPFGRYGGCLSGIRADNLMAIAIRALTARCGFDLDAIEDVVVGDANQAGEDGRNVARFSALMAGIPIAAGGVTVNRLCGSGMAAVLDAARCIRCGEGDLIIAGGVESMSRAPFAILKSETPFGRPLAVDDTTLGMRFPNPDFVKPFGNDTLIQTAETIARDFAISREAADRLAAASQSRHAQAQAEGFFDDELTPVEIQVPRKKTVIKVERDEHPRPDTTFEVLSKLRPLTAGGIVTAGNASGINDGAAALFVGNREIGERSGIAPRVRIVASAVAGVEPGRMGMGPVPAASKALARAGLTLKDMDLIEINEAFAVQVLGCLEALEIDPGDSRLNPRGGAIAVGHPLGASGARLTLTAMRQLCAGDGRYALVSLCIGVGQGIALILEKV